MNVTVEGTGWHCSLSLTPCFSGVFANRGDLNRFNGFPHPVETVETVLAFYLPLVTQLKLGVNGIFTRE